MTTKLRVLFRTDPENGEVTAFLPDVEANWPYITCYAHVGQHSEASREYYYATRAATPEEYGPLLTELRRIYEGDDDLRLMVRSRLARRRMAPASSSEGGLRDD